MKFLIGIVVLLILVLAGCSTQTTVKYQCADGSFVDSVADCPVKTETKVETQTVEKISNLNIQEITKTIRTTKFEKDASFCDNPSNYNLEKISLTPYSIESGNSFSELFEMGKYGSNQWYPSLKEGWIGVFPIVINNEGCTKLSLSDFTSTYRLFYNKKEIFRIENVKLTELDWGGYGSKEYIYPQENNIVRRGLYNDPNSYDHEIILTSSGDYEIKGTIFHKGQQIGTVTEGFTLK